MNLIGRVRADEDRELRTQAALHGCEIKDDRAPASRRSGLLSFHERMKQRLRGRG